MKFEKSLKLIINQIFYFKTQSNLFQPSTPHLAIELRSPANKVRFRLVAKWKKTSV